MRKDYISPTLHSHRCDVATMLAASGVTSDKGIGYGGVDADGDKDPSAKGNPFGDSVFDF